MKTTTFTKKLKLYPIGDKEEVNRVYQYIRNGQYNQYLALNRLMSELGTLYYHCNRDITSEEFKEGRKILFRVENPILDDIEFPKGSDIRSSVCMRVSSDFSTALKNGLAKGERNLPFYKRNFPLLAKGRSLSVYKKQSESENDEFIISWVNHIEFKVIMGSSGKNNCYLTTMLENLAEKSNNYKICGSQFKIEDGKIFLFLVVQKQIEDVTYIPQKGRILGVAAGYDKPLVCVLNDSDEQYEVGSAENFIEKRIAMQKQYQRLQANLRECRGGRGRSHKLAALDRYKKKEKNYALSYNHLLSKQVIELALKLKVETIILEDINMNQLKQYPTLLRNWSYYQLNNLITYKGKKLGITVITGKSKQEGLCCCKCGIPFEKKDILPENLVWSEQISFTCSECGKTVDYSFNKAKNLAVIG